MKRPKEIHKDYTPYLTVRSRLKKLNSLIMTFCSESRNIKLQAPESQQQSSSFALVIWLDGYGLLVDALSKFVCSINNHKWLDVFQFAQSYVYYISTGLRRHMLLAF